MTDLSSAQQDWITKYSSPTNIQLIAGDASFRRYYRVNLVDKNLIFVDASKETDSFDAYIKQSEHLQRLSLPIPKVIAANNAHAWGLLEDFGEKQFIDQVTEENAQDYYQQAVNTLVTFNESPIASYGKLRELNGYLMEELHLFTQWCVNQLYQITLSAQDKEQLQQCFNFIVWHVQQQPTIFIHRDYHSKNLFMTDRGIAIIDFQDAMAGPLTYDLASLLRDCYINWPESFVMEMVQFYHQQSSTNATLEQFIYWFNMTATQRHLKALMTFSRKALRDRQPEYLAFIPRTLNYLLSETKNTTELQYLHQLCTTLLNTKITQ